MKIGVAQCDVTFNDPAANLKRAEKWISEAASQSIDLLVFPECFLTGYCVDSVEDAAKISLFCTADKTGVATSDEPSINGMTQLAKAYGLYIVFGFAGRDEQGLYNGSLMVSPEGSAHRYIKTHLPCLGLDRFVRGGSSLDVVRCGDARVGTLICYDIRPPEAARTLALKGADIILLPTNWPSGASTSPSLIVPARAAENKVYVAACNRVGTENGYGFIGRSSIVDPYGTVLASADDQETLLVAEIDPLITRDKCNVVQPYGYTTELYASRRPELYGAITQPLD